ncbi:MAG: glutamate--tRNA ligase, partial [Deltaproteobacteria bacterium]
MTKPRVRFAPSPTGYLHIGGARTALFNWLWARKTGGSFVLRIEDTDQARNTRESVEAIFDSMRWLGMDWDEGPQHPDDTGGGPHGPYFQMQRLGIYREHAERLIREGKAYRCFCTKEDIDALKNKLPEKARAGFKYPGTCRDRVDQPDKPHVVRFKSPTEGVVTFQDLVFGELTTPNSAQTDFVLLRTDGVPLYNFGAVVDDVTMAITLVARGKDHIVNTAPQILLYRAFDYPLPQFAHLPMMMANKNEKLSKRHGSVSVSEYRDKGFLPEGLLSYLVRFGWSHGDDEVFTLASLVEKFDWEHVGKSDGIYDFKKCVAINQKYLARVPTTEQLATEVVPFLAKRDLAVLRNHPSLEAAVTTVRERSDT